MIVDKRINLKRLVKGTRKRIAFTIGYTLVVYLLYRTHVASFTLPIAVPAMMGTGLAILLGFRTNSAYDRWWEARKVWGAIINDSRTLARQVMGLFILPPGGSESDMAALQRTIVYRQIAWSYMLARTLRGQEWIPDVQAMLSSAEIDVLRLQDNCPNAILQSQMVCLREAFQSGYVDPHRLLAIEGTLSRLCDSMGKCERIKNTVFPVHFSFLISLIAWVFLFLLPSGLVADIDWFAVPVAIVIASVFLLIERLAKHLQDPFANRMSDTPMLALSRTIEINLRQQLHEADVPEKLQPVDGVLW
jgi:putative membrane protein